MDLLELKLVNNQIIVSIQVKVNSNIGQKLKFGNITVSCPSDFLIFCSAKACNDSCNNRGFCIKGSCICIAPYRGQFCEIKCDKFLNNGRKLIIQQLNNV